ncbi:MAG: hypothetical protein ABR548_12140 [Actinomycetota bacterium]|nr:hypothetical protein [Actinomycetota bacterium]
MSRARGALAARGLGQMRIRMVAAIAGVVTLCVPFGARASNCSSRVAILSHVAENVPTVDANAFVCAVAPGADAPDTRLINPGSTQLGVRYVPEADVGADPPDLGATINGLGLVNRNVSMTWTQVVGGLYAYQSEWVTINVMETGRVTATIHVTGSPTVTYHTLGS